MSKRLTTDDFIKRSKYIHNDKYDYSLVNYTNQRIKVKIICPIHGIFEQLPDNHYKYGCFECGGKKKLTTSEFINKSNSIHNNKYDYSLVEYKNCGTKVKIICKEHGIFEQTPECHIYDKCGCSKCNKLEKLTTDEFKKRSKEIHGDKYDYSLVKYNGIDTKVDIICKEHGIFKQTPSVHIHNKSGCSKCANINSRINVNEFIKRSKEIHGNRYDYSLVDYINQRTKIKIICPIHGIFNQTPNKHLQNRGCPHCRMSKGESKIKNFLENEKIDYSYEYKFNNCKNINTLLFDFYLPKYNTCIEYDGEQHFKVVDIWGGINEFNNIKKRDNIKNEYCKNNNIQLIRIKYDENIINILKNKILYDN